MVEWRDLKLHLHVGATKIWSIQSKNKHFTKWILLKNTQNFVHRGQGNFSS